VGAEQYSPNQKGLMMQTGRQLRTIEFAVR
jgi:hypothetical protein